MSKRKITMLLISLLSCVTRRTGKKKLLCIWNAIIQTKHSVHTYIHTLCTFHGPSPYGLVQWGFCVFFLTGVVSLGLFFYFILLYFSFFLWGLVTLPHASRFIVTCILSSAILRVSVVSPKISSLVVFGVSLFSHCCSTWSWVSSSWWHILHVLSGYLFL